MKVCFVNSKKYDVMSFEQYMNQKDYCDPTITGIEDNGFVYPVRNKMSNEVGLYKLSKDLYQFRDPKTEEEKKRYSAEGIINFDDAKSLREIIEKTDQLKNAERTILTTPDNITIPVIGENDSPEMVGLKEAVIAKHIDIDKYQTRFGANFSNDKRLLNDNSITLLKLKTMFKALDMKGTLIIEDSSEDVANPIGRKIVIDLLGGDTDESK